jgi:hypothetical protein
MFPFDSTQAGAVDAETVARRKLVFIPTRKNRMQDGPSFGRSQTKMDSLRRRREWGPQCREMEEGVAWEPFDNRGSCTVQESSGVNNLHPRSWE